MSLAGQRIAIAGGGIIGLAAALELARAGARVSVFEREACMQQASWAAAGMLAVDDPENDRHLLPLAQLARALYPGFLAEIEQLSGMAVPLRTARTLQAHRRLPDGPASASPLPEFVPELVSGQWRYDPLDEASLDPRDLCRALPIAVRAAGVTVHEQNPITHAAADCNSVRVTLGAGGVVEADALVIAAGAWSGQLALDELAPVPVGPCKGQMIEVLLPEGGAELPCVVRSAEIYLVPRTSRRLVVGATVEQAGFDRSLDGHAAARLLALAAELWPPILTARTTAQWSGLRPNPSDVGLPLIGPLEAHGRIWAATGHYRNGILLAPATARLLSAMMAGASAPVDPAPFSPSR